jgi:hypothetical protein
MKTLTKEKIISTLDKNGFDFAAFEYENEYSAKNLLIAINELMEEDRGQGDEKIEPDLCLDITGAYQRLAYDNDLSIDDIKSAIKNYLIKQNEKGKT